MTGIFIQNIESPAQIVANGFYGCDFKISIFNQDDGTYLAQNMTAVELREPIVAFSTVTIANQASGDTDIELSSIIGLNTGDRIKISNYIYKITNILANTITIHKGLYENISSNAPCTREGHLGIYKLDLEFGDLGIYTLIAKDSIFGLQVTKMVKVQPKSIETMYNDIKNLEYAILGS